MVSSLLLMGQTPPKKLMDRGGVVRGREKCIPTSTCLQTVSHKSKQTALENGNGGMNSFNSRGKEGRLANSNYSIFLFEGKKDVFLYSTTVSTVIGKRIIFGKYGKRGLA